MEIYQLRAFVTVAKLGHLTRAAEALHVTQPAVTAQIKALEETLGVALFDRRPGRMALTKAAELLLPEAEHLLSVAGAFLGKARELRGKISGVLSIGTIGDPDSLRLGSLLAALKQSMPLLDLRTRKGHAQELYELVSSEALQAAFYIGSNIPRDVLGLPLQTVYYRIAAPFAFRQRVLHAGWREMADMPWIAAPRGHHSLALFKDMFARQGLLPQIALEADEVSAVHSLIRAGLGLSLLREEVALPASERDELVIWPHTRVAAVLSFIYPKTMAHDPALTATLSQLRNIWGLSSPP
jgi:DNA-binding transcriptional LysR family regulator